MDVNELARLLSLVLAPVVMISCCTLFLNGQLTRYDSISARMRIMNQERFEILRAADNSITSALDTIDGLDELRVSEIEAQLPHLLKRHKMVHDAALILGMAIFTFVVSMLVLAIAAITNLFAIEIAAILVFLLALIFVVCGGAVIMREIYKSHLSVRYEVMHALSLGQKAPPLTAKHKVAKRPIAS